MTTFAGTYFAPDSEYFDLRERNGYEQNDQYFYGFSSGFILGNTQGYGSGFQEGYLYGVDETNALHDGDELSQIAYVTGQTDGQSKGYAQGFSDGKSFGHSMGLALGLLEGQETQEIATYEDGLGSGSQLGGASGDLTSPVVTDLSLPVTPNDPWIVSVYDGLGLSLVQLSCRDTESRLTVYDPLDGGFVHPFGGKSTISGSGTSADPYIFTVYRRGGWPTGVDFSLIARAIDFGGNETDG